MARAADTGVFPTDGLRLMPRDQRPEPRYDASLRDALAQLRDAVDETLRVLDMHEDGFHVEGMTHLHVPPDDEQPPQPVASEAALLAATLPITPSRAVYDATRLHRHSRNARMRMTEVLYRERRAKRKDLIEAVDVSAATVGRILSDESWFRQNEDRTYSLTDTARSFYERELEERR